MIEYIEHIKQLTNDELIVGQYVQSLHNELCIYKIGDNIEILIPAYQVTNGGELIKFPTDITQYSVKNDKVYLCETVITKELNKDIYRDNTLNDLGI